MRGWEAAKVGWGGPALLDKACTPSGSKLATLMGQYRGASRQGGCHYTSCNSHNSIYNRFNDTENYLRVQYSGKVV